MLNKIIMITTIVSLCLLVFLLNVTTPATAGPFGILAIFIFAYLSSLGVVTYFLYGISRVITYLSVEFMVRRPLEPLTLKRSYYYSTIVAAAPILLAGLQSVGAGGIYEFTLVLIFVVIGCLYVSKRSH
jgi:hypothetical protein